MSAKEEDSDLDKFIQSRLEEMMPADTEDATKVKPIFHSTNQAVKADLIFPCKHTSFLPPVEKRQEDRTKEGLLVDRKPQRRGRMKTPRPRQSLQLKLRREMKRRQRHLNQKSRQN